MKEYQTEGPRIELMGNHRAVIDGCDGIMGYEAHELRLKMGKLQLCIQGKALKLQLLTENAAVVEGLIHSISYEQNQKRG